MSHIKQQTQKANSTATSMPQRDAAVNQKVHDALTDFSACIYSFIDYGIIAEFPIDVLFKYKNLTIRLMVKPPSDSSLTLNA